MAATRRPASPRLRPPGARPAVPRWLVAALVASAPGCGGPSTELPRADGEAVPSPAPEIGTPAVEAPAGAPPPGEAGSGGTRVVLLGTGTPNAEPAASGPATAIVVGDRAYLVDAGPGVVRRAAAAAARHDLPALEAARLDIAFLTHLHSDHTVGLPDLVHTPWVLERASPLRLFGPDGTGAMAGHLTAAWGPDIENRLSGRQPATPDGWRIEAVDIDPGLVYEDERVRVTAFAVRHAGWDEAYGYRFDTADRSIVISGDTAPTDAIVAACDGCDVLVHEVYSAVGFLSHAPEWQRYHARAHTSSVELAALASRARPALLVLHHQLLWGVTPGALLEEIRAAGYEGDVAYGRDLDIY